MKRTIYYLLLCLLIAFAVSSCATNNCRLTRGFIGYGSK